MGSKYAANTAHGAMLSLVAASDMSPEKWPIIFSPIEIQDIQAAVDFALIYAASECSSLQLFVSGMINLFRVLLLSCLATDVVWR